MGPRDDVDRYQLADLVRSLCTRFGCRLHGTDITRDDHGDKAVAHYRQVLNIDPEGNYGKLARQQLQGMGQAVQ